MKKWTAGITLGLTALTGSVDRGVSADPPQPIVKSIDAEKKPIQHSDKNLDQVRQEFEKLGPKEQIQLFQSLNDKQQAQFVETLEAEKEKFPARAQTIELWLRMFSRAENDAWLKACKVRISDMEELASNAYIIDKVETFAYDSEEWKPIGFDEFTKLMSPKITRITVDSPIRNHYAYGFIMETGVDPTDVPAFAKPSKERISRLNLAIDKPDGEVHFKSITNNGVSVTFPKASPNPKGNVSLADADIKQLYEMVTREGFKVENSFIPWRQNEKQEDKLARAKEFRLTQGIISGIKLNTAPGVKVHLEKLQGTECNPYSFSGPANATYFFDKNSRYIKVSTHEALPAPESFQNVAIYNVSLEVAQELKAEHKDTPAPKIIGEDDKDIIHPLGSKHVILRNVKQDLELKCGGNYYESIPELEKAGTKLGCVKGILRIWKDNQYVDIPMMEDTKFAHKDEKALEESIKAAIKTLDPMTKPHQKDTEFRR